MARGLYAFVEESNRIEGIHRPPSDLELGTHEEFLELGEITVEHLVTFVGDVARAKLRDREGMNVRVGGHYPQPGGEGIRIGLVELLGRANTSNPDLDTPWTVHAAYERLHPFMDGNGRSGRVLWAWMRIQQGRDPFALGFLHSAYYEALEASRA